MSSAASRSVSLLGSTLVGVGERRLAAPDRNVVAGLQVGSGSPLNPKQWPCEDSVGIERLERGWLACVADAHWGGRSGEQVVTELPGAFRRTAAEAPVERRLGAALRDVERSWRAHPEWEDDGSETTALAVHVEGRTVSWASIGDSVVFLASAGELRMLHAKRHVFLGGRQVVAEGEVESGQVEGQPGDVVLLATDGLEPRSSALEATGVAEILASSGVTLEQRVVALLECADDVHRGAGRDNLGVVAFTLAG